MRDALLLFDFNDEATIHSVKALLLHCFVNPLFLKTKEGRKLCVRTPASPISRNRKPWIETAVSRLPPPPPQVRFPVRAAAGIHRSDPRHDQDADPAQLQVHMRLLRPDLLQGLAHGQRVSPRNSPLPAAAPVYTSRKEKSNGLQPLERSMPPSRTTRGMLEPSEVARRGDWSWGGSGL